MPLLHTRTAWPHPHKDSARAQSLMCREEGWTRIQKLRVLLGVHNVVVMQGHLLRIIIVTQMSDQLRFFEQITVLLWISKAGGCGIKLECNCAFVIQEF